MSAFEQKVEAPNKDYQYLLLACDPYDTIGFKIPNIEIDKVGKNNRRSPYCCVSRGARFLSCYVCLPTKLSPNLCTLTVLFWPVPYQP